MTERRFVSLRAKLSIAINAVVLFTAAAVYVALTEHEWSQMVGAKELAARMAAGLFLRAVATPIDFADQRGIDDTVALLGHDTSVLSVELWPTPRPGVVGERIAAHGLEGVKPRWIEAPAIERLSDRIVLHDLVRDQSGKPIAVAAVQYSLASEQAAFDRLRIVILLTSAAIAAFVSLLLWIAGSRWITGPIRRLLKDVRELEAGGSAAFRATTSNDELGRLAGAFRRMAEAVDRREKDVARRNADLQLVLDNVGQGFLVIDPEGKLAPERSAVVDRWFGAPEPGATVSSYLAKVDGPAAEMIELVLESIREAVLPLEITVDQFPKRLRSGERHFGVDWRPIAGERGLRGLVLVVTDVTREVEREHVERAERDLLAIASRIMADPGAARGFLDEADAIVRRVAARTWSEVELARDVHTLKGTSSALGLEGIASLCHEVEDAWAPEAIRRLIEEWCALLEKVEILTGARREVITLDAGEHANLCAMIRAHRPHLELLDAAERWRDDPVGPRLEWLASHAKELAKRLGKGAIDVRVEDELRRVPRDPYRTLWPKLVHVVRNAVDHGLEAEEDRAAAGKPPRGALTLRAFDVPGGFAIEIADDGRGIDWARLAARGRALGIAGANHADLVAALFSGGLSSKDEASLVSGRGMGLAAIDEAVRALGGEVEITSAPGRGTTTKMSFPLRLAMRRAG